MSSSLSGVQHIEQMLGEKLEVNETTLTTQKVVFVSFQGNKIWFWSLGGLLEKFTISNNTTYGVAVYIDEKSLEKEDIALIMQTSLLKIVEETVGVAQYKGKILLIERSPDSLTKREFQKIVKNGNLVKIIYNEVTKELIGIVLLDFNIV